MKNSQLSTLDRAMLDIDKSSVVVVGSGLFGLTIAERVASQLGLKVTVIESRNHFGGNSYSYKDAETGIEIHKYGTHIFHTNNTKVWEYINQFSEFTSYRHHVVASSQGNIYNLPINLQTISNVFGGDISPKHARKILNQNSNSNPKNFEEKAIANIGETLYYKFFHGYTSKQWGCDPKLLPAETFSRLPIRTDMNSEYFSDKFQGMPIDGYGKLTLNMMNSPLITAHLNIDYFTIRHKIDLTSKILIYTGPIDRYFNYKYGLLGWRTVDLEFEKIGETSFQGIGVKNFCDMEIPYTRIHEFKFLHPERSDILGLDSTVIAREYSRIAGVDDEPYYPVNNAEDRAKLTKYRDLADNQKDIIFGGRLGSYQYLDMHMAIASALTIFENKIKSRFKNHA